VGRVFYQQWPVDRRNRRRSVSPELANVSDEQCTNQRLPKEYKLAGHPESFQLLDWAYWARSVMPLALAALLYYLRQRETQWKPAGDF
jgi:hypothetical protein